MPTADVVSDDVEFQLDSDEDEDGDDERNFEEAT